MLRQAQHERGGVVHRLRNHPDAPPRAITGIEVTLAPGSLRYVVAGDQPLMPHTAAPVRTDGLWRTTCFELFVKPVGVLRYFELNFSPSTAWAAYSFEGYRAGMSDLELPAPIIMTNEQGVGVTFDHASLPPGDWRIGLSAVIEEIDGTKSYWALAHPPGKPDFHHEACFALELPALDAA